MMVLCTQVNKMYVIATLSVYPHRGKLARWGYTLRVAKYARGQAYFSSLPGGDIHSE